MSDTGNRSWLAQATVAHGQPRQGLSYTPAVGQTYDEWDRDGKRLAIINTATRWALGDWMNAGESSRTMHVGRQRPSPPGTEYWWQQNPCAFPIACQLRTVTLNSVGTIIRSVAALDPQEQRFLLEECFDRKWDIDQLRAQAALVRNGHTPLEIEQSNEAAAAYRAAKEGTPDTAPVRKIDDLTKEARQAKKAAAIKKYQERRDLQERKAAEVAERKRRRHGARSCCRRG